MAGILSAIKSVASKFSEKPLVITDKFLTVNKWSRPGIKKKNDPKGIEIHWVANPNTSAIANWNYFESRKGGKFDFGSTQYIIDLLGQIFRCIPDDEIAYSSGSKTYKDGIVSKLGNPPYYNTVSIELTHPDWSGKPTKETYNSCVDLCVNLCTKYKLTAANIYRHYDITGKDCPKYYVENPAEWAKFKDEVDKRLK